MSACSEVPFAGRRLVLTDDHSVGERKPARPDANQSRDKRPTSSPRRSSRRCFKSCWTASDVMPSACGISLLLKPCTVSTSWLNLVERWFAWVSEKQVKADLIAASAPSDLPHSHLRVPRRSDSSHDRRQLGRRRLRSPSRFLSDDRWCRLPTLSNRSAF
jgi:hypothetical protein